MKVRDVIRLIEKDGWQFERQRGSHRIYRHPEKPGTVTVAELAIGTCSQVHWGTSCGKLERRDAKMTEYVVIYEQGATSWGAYCPDLPGLGVTAGTRDEAERLIREGIGFHIDSLRKHGDPVPEPISTPGR